MTPDGIADTSPAPTATMTSSSGDHDLVEQRHTRGGSPQLDQGLPMTQPGERREVRVAEAVGHAGGLATRGAVAAALLALAWVQPAS
jgi:hypothetical protein